MRVRPAAVAGTFYPDRAPALTSVVDGDLAAGRVAQVRGDLVALIVPHAGFRYSGPVAASAYRMLRPLRDVVKRVVVAGPAHREYVKGMAVPSVDAFETPLGQVPLDREAIALLAGLEAVQLDDTPHAAEHSLEVHLPFLQRALGSPEGEISPSGDPTWALVPILVGDATDAEVAGALDLVWGGPETLVVVSTDLSHYLDYSTASARDSRTAAAVCDVDPAAIGDRDACGARPLRGLLAVAARRGLDVTLLDLRNSGDTSGPRDRVVGYGAFALTAGAP